MVVLTVLGIAAFTLVFQGRARYLFVYVPAVIALAASVDPLHGLRWPRPRSSDAVTASDPVAADAGRSAPIAR